MKVEIITKAKKNNMFTFHTVLRQRWPWDSTFAFIYEHLHVNITSSLQPLYTYTLEKIGYVQLDTSTFKFLCHNE